MPRDGAGGAARLGGGRNNEGSQFVGELIEDYERQTGVALGGTARSNIINDVAEAGANGQRLSTANIRNIIRRNG